MQPKYILETSKLQIADVVLTREKSGTSIGIQAMTASRYSHAAIHVGGTLIEATLAGVFSKNPQRLIFDRPTDVAVYRSKSRLTNETARRICDYAQAKVGSLYAIDEAVFVRPRSLLRIEASKRQFCSRLVAQAYSHIGFNLENLRNPAYCTPGQLARCKAFTRVDSIVRIASSAEIVFAESEDPNEEHFRQTFEWLGRVRESVKSNPSHGTTDIQTIEDVCDFLKLNPNFDGEFSAYVRSSGYLDFVNMDERLNPFRYDVNLFENRLITHRRHIEEIIESEIAKEDAIFERFCRMFDAHFHLARQCNLEFFRMHVILYFKLVRATQVRLSIIQRAVQNLGILHLFEELSGLTAIADRAVALGRNSLEVLNLDE